MASALRRRGQDLERARAREGMGRRALVACNGSRDCGGGGVDLIDRDAPVLHVDRLACAYPDGHQALFGVDLTIRRNERVALLGPNGAGKTTLVLHCNGVLTAGAGAVRVGGLPVEKRHLAEIRRRVGIVFQDPDDQLFMATARDDVAFGPTNFGVRGAELEARVDKALAAVGMEGYADRTPHHLSFGQRRRVAVATVLACYPQLLVLDEPSSNLDPASRRELADIVRSLDVTLLMVTHDLLYALELCPRAVVIDEGVIVADGRTEEILCDCADGSPPAEFRVGWTHRIVSAMREARAESRKSWGLWRPPRRGAGDVNYDAACLGFRRAKRRTTTARR